LLDQSCDKKLLQFNLKKLYKGAIPYQNHESSSSFLKNNNQFDLTKIEPFTNIWTRKAVFVVDIQKCIKPGGPT
jgi:hypothetical protein